MATMAYRADTLEDWRSRVLEQAGTRLLGQMSAGERR
jgi:hypothetical protein